MSGHEELWVRVNAALDARRDPWADADVRAVLGRDPEGAEALARLARRLALLETAAPVLFENSDSTAPADGRDHVAGRAAGRVARAAALVAAAAVLLAFLRVLLGSGGASSALTEPVGRATFALAPHSRVLSVRVTTVLEKPGERTEHVRDASGEHLLVTRALAGGGHDTLEIHQPLPRTTSGDTR